MFCLCMNSKYHSVNGYRLIMSQFIKCFNYTLKRDLCYETRTQVQHICCREKHGKDVATYPKPSGMGKASKSINNPLINYVKYNLIRQ